MKRQLLSFLLLASSLAATQVEILDVPAEMGAGTRGASLAGAAIRSAAMSAGSTYFLDHESTSVVVDQSTLLRPYESPVAKNVTGILALHREVRKAVAERVESAERFLVVIAGDHSSAAGTIAGIKQAYPDERLGVVWIDAHADIHSPYTTPSGNLHGMPVAIALAEDNLEEKVNEVDRLARGAWKALKEEGGIAPKIEHRDLIYVAVRDTEPAEDALLKRYAIPNLNADTVHSMSPKIGAQQILYHLRDCDRIYISFDVDAMDCSLSKGTGTPVENGITNDEAEQLISLLVKSPKVCCLEIAEVNPLLDDCNKMAEMTFQILEQVTAAVEAR